MISGLLQFLGFTPTAPNMAERPANDMPKLDFDSTFSVDDLKDAVPPPYSEQAQIWDKAKETLPSQIPGRPMAIAIMGPTGTGKSTFISKLAGREMKIGHSLSSCRFLQPLHKRIADHSLLLRHRRC